MSHGHAHEEAEHAAHHGQSPFDRRVAMTMVVIAALLAGMKLQAHRTHNDALGHQIKAGVNHGRSNVKHTEEMDQWNFYQAKKMRQHMYDSQADLLVSVVPADKQNDPAIKNKLADWAEQAKRYKKETKEIKQKAEDLKEVAENYEKAADKEEHASEHAHYQADFFDLGELGIELALILCSVAILTKRPPFWYGGMAVCAIGLGVGLIGFFVH